MQTNSKLHVDKIRPEHVEEICKIITKHFCVFDDEDVKLINLYRLKENGNFTYHNGIKYLDDDFSTVLREHDSNGKLIEQARTPKPSSFLVFEYMGSLDDTNHKINICFDYNGIFTYGWGGLNSNQLEAVLSSIPFLIDLMNYIKWIDVLDVDYELK